MGVGAMTTGFSELRQEHTPIKAEMRHSALNAPHGSNGRLGYTLGADRGPLCECRAVPSIRNSRHTAYRQFAVHVILPTAVGAMIYVLFRTTSLLVFDWLETFHLLQLSLNAREVCCGIDLPDWLLYSVPDGLWVYAVTSWMIMIWTRNPPLPWLLVGVGLGISGELGQLIGIVPGTYQGLDMVSYSVGFVAACLQLESAHETSLPFRFGAVGDGCLRLWKR